MLCSILTPIVVFLLSLGSSYFITRPIGDNRRHIAAVVIGLAFGVIGGVVIANMAVSVRVGHDDSLASAQSARGAQSAIENSAPKRTAFPLPRHQPRLSGAEQMTPRCAAATREPRAPRPLLLDNE
jgi:hypothetical protein